MRSSLTGSGHALRSNPHTPFCPAAYTSKLHTIFRTPAVLTAELTCVAISNARSFADLDDARLLLREYAESLSVDLSFQDFELELATLPGDYAAPRGSLLLAYIDGALAGCCALRPIDSTDIANAAEMKRLYVRKAFRGFGLGRQLAEAILDAARQNG